MPFRRARWRPHALPEAAARLAAEASVLATLLGSALKLDGRLTVQTKSDGPLDLITADYYGAEADRAIGVRAFARLDGSPLRRPRHNGAELFHGLSAKVWSPSPSSRSGAGRPIRASCRLRRKGSPRPPRPISRSPNNCRRLLRLAAAPLFTPGDQRAHWRAGGMMLQATPETAVDVDDWERLSLFLATLEDIELVDTGLSAETLLWRLFHEDEVRVHPAEPIVFRCGCDRSRIASVFRAYAPGERDGLADRGRDHPREMRVLRHIARDRIRRI